MKTHQQTFDEMVEHVKTQKKPAYERRQCRYLTSSGEKCIVGGLIPDTEYHKGIENQNADSPTVAPILKKLGHDPQFCSDAQEFYDWVAALEVEEVSIGQWGQVLKEELKDFAKKKKLVLNW